MYIEDFEIAVRRLSEDHLESEEYLQKLLSIGDNTVYEFITSNVYADILCRQNDFFINVYFGPILAEKVFWFLYVRKPIDEIVDHNVKYLIDGIETFVEAIKQIYNLPMKPKEGESCS